jgi:hypothetical protein
MITSERSGVLYADIRVFFPTPFLVADEILGSSQVTRLHDGAHLFILPERQ